MVGSINREVMDELGSRFGSKLRLSEKEHGGIIIERKDVEGAILGLQYTLIAEVLTSKEVNGEVFTDRFMSLWRGREGVSIRDIGNRRFLARFAGQRDLLRVVEADQPWTFKNDLVMVADRKENGRNRWAPLSEGTFWVQMHNVPVLSMTQAVAKSIGGLMGVVSKVDKSGSRDCIGRFLRVKINFNVREPLMRGTFVNFPDDGKIWVDFKYEALPKYCLACGMLGHATRICHENQNANRDDGGSSEERKEEFAFQGLDATCDLRGNPLSSGGKSKVSQGSNEGRKNTDKWQDEKSEDRDGGWRSARSSTASGARTHAQHFGSRTHSESGCTDKADEDEMDIAISPNKPRGSSNKQKNDRLELATKIRNQRKGEEIAREARELAFDAGLIGSGGVVAHGAEHITLHDPPEHEAWMPVPEVSPENEQGFDLNVEPDIAGVGAFVVTEGGVTIADKTNEELSAGNGKHIDDDPFDLEEIIEAVTKENKSRKRSFRDVESTVPVLCLEPRCTKQRRSLFAEAEETSLTGSPNAP
ncbi:hypothetical protein ACFX16_003954 [Malus domestica]